MFQNLSVFNISVILYSFIQYKFGNLTAKQSKIREPFRLFQTFSPHRWVVLSFEKDYENIVKPEHFFDFFRHPAPIDGGAVLSFEKRI